MTKIGSISTVNSDQIDRIEADTTSIESKVDVVDTIVDRIDTDTSKIDDVAVSGLSGVANSLAYKIATVERHHHGREKWFGVAASPSGETHVADRVGGATTAFTLTSGASTFGNWVQILGSSDTPVAAGSANYDAHRFLVTGTNSTSPYIIQIAGGESAELAGLLSSELFTEVMYVASSNLFDSGVQDILTSKVAAGTKVWARCACIGQSGKTISFYFGIHEYEG